MMRAMLPFILVVTLAAANAEPIRLAAVPLTGIGIENKRAEFFNDYIAQRLSEQGLLVTTPSTVQAILGHERQKALLGCASEGDEATRCLVEMSGALGVDALVVGSVAQLSPGFAVNLKIVSARDGTPFGAESGRVDSEAALLDFFGQAAERLAAAVKWQLRGEAPQRRSFLSGTRKWSWIPGVVAVGTGATAAVFFMQAKSADTALRTGDASIANAQAALALKQSGQTQQTIAVALVATAAVSAGITVAMLLFGADAPVTAAIGADPASRSALIQFSWRTP